MNEYWIVPEQLFDGQVLRADRALCVEAGQIIRLCAKKDISPGPMVEHIKGIVCPGFVDLQVNGGGGVLLNTTPSVAGMRDIAAAHRSVGTAAILPTVITDAPDVMEQAAAAAIAAKGVQGVAGLHIEGPHISMARRGTHSARYVRPLNGDTLALARTLRDAGVPVMMTLAPEAATNGQIAELAEMGVVVSIGHSDTTADNTRAAIDAGARCFTHLFNAMSPMLNRAPGVVGAAINSDAYCGFICDGHHVADEMLSLAIRARPCADRMFLVSDAMPTVGGPSGFDLYGQPISLIEGKLVNSEGSLAGAHVTQLEGVARLVSRLDVPLSEALRMAVTVPAMVMDMPHLACLDGRCAADVIVLSNDLTGFQRLPALGVTVR